jgi:hypothetical protein
MNSHKTMLRHIAAFLASIVFLFLALGSADNSSNGNPNGNIAGAAIAMEYIVKARLKAPATAKFPGYTTEREQIKYLGNNTYSATSWVDSQNSFGALLRKKFTCHFTYGDDTYKEIDFTWLE